MKKNTYTQLAISVAVFAFAASSSVHALNIDTFDVAEQTVTATVTVGTPTNTAIGQGGPASLTDVIGGYRDIKIDAEFIGATGGGTSNVLVDGFDSNTLVVNNDNNVDAVVSVTWDANGNGLGSGLGVDLLGGSGDASLSAFILDVLAIDANGVEITVDLTDVGSNSVSRSDTFFTPGQFYIVYSDFTGLIDFEHITSISMQLDGVTPSWDGEVDIVFSDPVPTATPAPGTLALLGLGLVGFGVRRVKRG